MRLRIVCLVIFLCGLGLFTASITRSREVPATETAKIEPRPFVVHYIAYSPEKGDSLEPVEYSIRAVNADGEWKETRYSLTETKRSTLGASKDGLFIIKGDSRQYYAEFNAEIARNAMRSEKEMKLNPQFTRTEQLAGLTTYILKVENGMEIGYSPLTGATPLKEVLYSNSDNNKILHLLEAVKVEFRELSKDEIDFPVLPVRFDIAEQKIESLKSAGFDKQAEVLRQGINKLKSNSQ
jgi:hypothetical protein